jgi:hypothetical protein
METMILVVVLAVAGLAGIAAAFYFSIRSGRRGDSHNSRLRSARGSLRSGGSAADSGPERAGIGSRAANGDRPANARRANQASRNYEDDTGLNSTMDFGKLAVPSVRRTAVGLQAEAEADGDASGVPPGFEADTAEEGKATRTRRRVGFRKGSDVDEELWPTETFGGVSDEQFWDDLASDKPLTTTARTAQQDSGRRSGQAAQRIEPRGRDQTPRPPEPPGRASSAGRGSAAAAPGADIGPGTDAGADIRAVSPAEAADHALAQPGYGATQPVSPLTPVAAPRSAAAQPMTTQLKPVGGTGPLPASARGPASARQPGSGRQSGSARQPGAAEQPGEGRWHASPSAEDDPLTSSAFSLREAGPVDGRSLRAAGPSRGGDYQPSPAEESQPLAPGDPGGGGYLPSPPAPRYPSAGYGAAPYGSSAYDPAPYGAAAYAGEPDSTPPNADTYGYRSPGPLDEPRRPNPGPPNPGPHNPGPPNGWPPNGARPNARHAGAGPDDRGRSARPAYPQQPGQPGGRHQSGGYRSGGYPANGYPETGRHGGGHRPAYDPREDHRQLTPPALPAGRRPGAGR